MMIKTRLTTRLGLTHPVMSAPMAGHSGGRLAGAVSAAGGLGAFGGMSEGGPDWVREQIRLIRSATDRPFAVGFITHLLPLYEANFEATLAEKVPVIAFSFADPRPWLERAKEAGATVMCQVQTIEGAREAVAAGADIIVAQGNEAGGHTGRMNLLPFLAWVLDEFPDVPVLAAGGIASGRSLAAVLAAGADGAWVGTAFLATPEAVEVPDAYKGLIVDSDGQDTVYTEVFDILAVEAYGIPPWPKGIAVRALRNQMAEEWHGREEELRRRVKEVTPIYLQGREAQNPEVDTVFFGQSAGSVESIRPAAQVLQGICADAGRLLRNCSSMVE